MVLTAAVQPSRAAPALDPPAHACSCRIPNLDPIRAGLGLTQDELALMLRCSTRRIREYEHAPHRCLPRGALGYLRGYLRAEPWRSLVDSAGLAHPYAEDLAARPRATEASV